MSRSKVPEVRIGLKALRADAPGELLRANREYGDLVRVRLVAGYGMSRCIFLVCDPDWLRHILVTNARHYIKSESVRHLGILMGRGLATSNLGDWKTSREVLAAEFSQSRLDRFMHPVAVTAAEMRDRFAGFARSGTAVDLDHEFSRYTMTIAIRCFFGERYLDMANELVHAARSAWRFANARSTRLFPSPLWLPTRANRKFWRDRNVFRQFADRVAYDTPLHDFGAALRRSAAASPRGLSQQLRDEIVTFLVAGFETTSSAISFLFLALDEYSGVRERVIEEIRQLGMLGAFNPAEVGRLQFTRRVVQETLRLWPAAWLFERRALRTDKMNGVSVPAGSRFWISPFVLHRHTSWKHPDTFDPDRDEFRSGQRPKSYLPFGCGERACLAQRLAEMEMYAALCNLLGEVRIRPTNLGYDAGITLRPNGPLLAYVE